MTGIPPSDLKTGECQLPASNFEAMRRNERLLSFDDANALLKYDDETGFSLGASGRQYLLRTGGSTPFMPGSMRGVGLREDTFGYVSGVANIRQAGLLGFLKPGLGPNTVLIIAMVIAETIGGLILELRLPFRMLRTGLCHVATLLNARASGS